MYVNCQGALAIEIWPGIFILKNLKVHQNQKNGAKQPNGYILSAYHSTMEAASVEACIRPVAVIRTGSCSIAIATDIPETILAQILKEVSHA